jgi:hypothetical protein
MVTLPFESVNGEEFVVAPENPELHGIVHRREPKPGTSPQREIAPAQGLAGAANDLAGPAIIRLKRA